MNGTVNRLIGRLLPTLLLAFGVMFLTAGLLSYATSTLGEPRAANPSAVADPRTEPGSSPSVESPAQPSAQPPAAPSAAPTPTPQRSPGATPQPEPSATVAGAPSTATRIRIAALEIDLPIVAGDLVVPGNEDLYPLCDVAMYLVDFVQPGQPGTAYIYAHAQRGMFLPLLRTSEEDDGAAMIGALVEVYTADEKLHLYEIDRVKRHATDLSITNTPPGVHQLVLQTSEGPSGTVPKLQVAARAVSVVDAPPGEALPEPQPRVCLPD